MCSAAVVVFPQDILKEVDEMVELSSGVELLLASVVRLAGAANVTNSAATELVQVCMYYS